MTKRQRCNSDGDRFVSILKRKRGQEMKISEMKEKKSVNLGGNWGAT